MSLDEYPALTDWIPFHVRMEQEYRAMSPITTHHEPLGHLHITVSTRGDDWRLYVTYDAHTSPPDVGTYPDTPEGRTALEDRILHHLNRMVTP